jgi:hypothetical protein
MVAMKQRVSSITTILTLAACIYFLGMFFAAATLERTADLGGFSSVSGQDVRVPAHEFAARWRHGMAGNSPLYMPGFFATALAIWLWCGGRSLRRTLVEGAAIIVVASWGATVLAPFAAPKIIAEFQIQRGFILSNAVASGTWIAFAQGVYTLLTWSALIVASRFSARRRSFTPMVVPFVLYVVLALVRRWTMTDISSSWSNQILALEPAAVISFLLIPIMATFMAWVELRSPHRKRLRLTKSIESH